MSDPSVTISLIEVSDDPVLISITDLISRVEISLFEFVSTGGFIEAGGGLFITADGKTFVTAD